MTDILEKDYSKNQLVQIETDQSMHKGFPYVGITVDYDHAFLTLSPYLRIDPNAADWRAQIEEMVELGPNGKSKKTLSTAIIATIEEVVLNSNGNK